MDDFLSDPKLHSALVAIMVAVGGWFMKREVHRIDQGLANAVKRNELEDLRADMDDRHQENRDSMAEIKQGVTDTHRRIDDLYNYLASGHPNPRRRT